MRTPYVVAYFHPVMAHHQTEGFDTQEEIVDFLTTLLPGTRWTVYTGDCNIHSKGIIPA